MKRNREAKVTKKVVRRSGFGSGVSNYDALGHTIKENATFGNYSRKHPDCIIMIKDGVAKRMDETNEGTGGNGHACVVYRTPANQ